MAASDELAPEDIAAAIAEVPGQVGPSLHDMPLGGGFSSKRLSCRYPTAIH